MPVYTKLIEPNKDELIKWFKKAKYGEQCEVATVKGEVYTFLTKLSPFMVKWKVAGFIANDADFSNQMRFTELVEIWGDMVVR